MSESQPQQKYDPLVKTLHWVWALIWISVWFMGILGVYWRDAFNADNGLTVTHKSFGISVLVLIVLWSAWRLFLRPSQPMATMTQAERAAHIGHLMLVVLGLFALPLSGWLWTSLEGEPVTLLGLVNVPLLVDPNPAYLGVAKWVHVIISWLLGLLVLAHGGTALKHHFVDRDNTLRNMLPG